MKLASRVFAVWAILVGIWWIISDPESAPQQAALAGQALVLLGLPYFLLAALQREESLQTIRIRDRNTDGSGGSE